MTASETSGGMTRRSLARGAAWTLPVVAMAAPAPAFAASPPKITGTVCALFYGSGTINLQVHTITLGLTSDTGTIPAGTVMTWTVTQSGGSAGTGGANEVPTAATSASWTVAYSPATGTVTNSYTVTVTINIDLPSGYCGIPLIYTDIFTVRPGAAITVTYNGVAAGPAQTGDPSSLSYTAARRHPTAINTTGRVPHIYVSRSGGQTCYPEIQYSRLLSRDGFDNVTCYPSGTTLPNPCTWGGLSCGGTTGLCVPRTSLVTSGQYLTPQVC